MTINCDCGKVLCSLPMRHPGVNEIDGATVERSIGIWVHVREAKLDEILLHVVCGACGREAIVVEW